MLRRLHPDQPESFAFTEANQRWAEAQITKYPEGRQASAVIPLLWRAQEQEGWLTRPAMEHVAEMLDMAYMRVLEVATFYFMFQLAPVGSVAHVQICGTTSCMICGAEDLVAVCKEKIAKRPHQLSADGKFSWEEVECLGACANAPMAQIGKDYYEDLTAERMGEILDEMAAGQVPVPGPQNGRFTSEPAGGLTSLEVAEGDREAHNGSVALAVGVGDTIKRIDGTEVSLIVPWIRSGSAAEPASQARSQLAAETEQNATKAKPADTENKAGDKAQTHEREPERLDAPQGAVDDLTRLNGIGPKLADLLNEMGFYHFHQIAAWGDEEIAWVDARLKFKGRITRDDWVGQAKALRDA